MRMNVVLDKIVQEMESTVLEVEFQDLSPSMQASLLKHKASKLKLRSVFLCARSARAEPEQPFDSRAALTGAATP